jgi:vitamin B12 transporter
MSRLFFFILFYLLNLNNSISKEISVEQDCKWDNKFNKPCLEIKGNISNTSDFSKKGTNKIIITKKQINESGALDLIDVLKSIPDINITQSGPKGQTASLFMRGTGSNHTLVMINGIPINDQSSTQGLHDFGVDFIHTIQQIEIYPGSSGTHFGTNAIGGAINIILTGDYKDSLNFISDINSNYELAVNKNYVYDNSALNLKFGTLKNKVTSARGKVDDEKDGVKNYSTNLNFEKYLNNNNKLFNTIYFRKTNSEYDNSNTNQTGYEMDNKMGSFQLGLESSAKNFLNKYQFYFNAYDREYNERGTIDTYESNSVGLKLDASRSIEDIFSIGFGTEYKYDWGYFDNNGSYEASTKGNTDNFALYSNLGWNILADTNISLFVRNDQHKITGSNKTYKLTFDQVLNDLNFGISYLTGLRNPTLYELFGTDNYGYSGNVNLDPEISSTYEVYSSYKINNKLNFSLRAFKSSIKNNIEYLNNQYQNDNDNIDLNQSGLNSNIKFISNNTSIDFFSSFLSSKKENNDSQLRRPNKNYGFALNKKMNLNKFGNFNIYLIYNHFGKHFDTHSTNFSTIEMDSIDLVDLKLNKSVFGNNLFIKVTNLLGENYQKPHGYNHENRAIKFGLTY